VGNEHSGYDEDPVLRKGKSQSTENQETKDPEIGEVLNDCTGIDHGVT